ncbi:carbohydrate-binding protein [Streptomyces sp. NPDC093094]|uniref:carbohydrate-binding protein n=1 Tax=Streptomyces sp. NPDC093094 TaxID=3366026 RepID=UPI003811AA83
MTPGDSGASTPEDDDPFGYLYADGQANGAQPPSGGYGYPNSVSRVRTVGERQYGQQQGAGYGQQVPQQAAYGQQQGAHNRPSAHYAAPETLPGGAPTAPQQSYGNAGGGRGRGPNTKGLLIGAIAVVAAVVIGIGVAMIGGDDDKGGKTDDQAGVDPTPTATQSDEPSPTATPSGDGKMEPLETDAKALRLSPGVVTAADVPGAKSDGGVYVAGLNQPGASVTWTFDGIPDTGKYTLYVEYGVPGKDASTTLSVNGSAQDRPLNMANFAKGPEGDYEKGWTETWANIQLNKGTNTIKLSCETGNQCDVNLDQMKIVPGWK